MRGVQIKKGRKEDTIFVLTFVEIMKSKISAKEKIDALNELCRVANDSLTSRMLR